MSLESDRTFNGLASRDPSALWLQVATFSLVSAMVKGFGAYDFLYPITPTPFLLFQAVLISCVLFLAPRGTVGSIFVPLTTLCFIGWWLLSYQWSTFRLGFTAASSSELATVVTMVLMASVIPVTQYIRCILYAGYISIGLVFVTIVLYPDSAFSSSALGETVAGLHGGFGHKNFMSASLCVTVAAVLAFESRRIVRGLVTLLALALILLSQSSTGLAAMVLVLVVHWVLNQYGWARRTFGRSFASVSALLGVIFIGVFALIVGPAISLIGKDMTFTGRTEIWTGVVDAIRKRPFIGYGWGGAWQDFSSEPTLSIVRPLGYPVLHSHNAVLELMLRAGVVGLGLYLLQFLAFMRLGWKAVNVSNPIGTFIFLFAGIVVIFGFSESMVGFGVFFGLIAAFPAMRLILQPDVRSSPPEHAGAIA